MNERIFQLAKQAQIKFEAHLQHLGIDTAVITPADLEKFAELIVRECMLICGAVQGAGEVHNMPEFASGAAQCKRTIKRDFGVN
jgi:hypothetical protein